MQIQKINFTASEAPQQKKEPAIYCKKGYMTLLTSAQFTEGLFGGFATFEAIDKFQLIKNTKNLTKEQLKAKAWKHTKWNMALALLTGALSVVIGKTITNKFLMPINEKMFDIAEKQKKVSQKAKELVEIENQKEQEVKNTEENKSEKTDN